MILGGLPATAIEKQGRKMKRVLCVLSSMNAGGAETFLMKIYRQLDKSKYQMDFCVNIFEKGFYDDEINQMGGKIFHIPSKSENIKEFKRQLFDIVKSNRYEYVLRITSNTMGFLDLKIAKKAGARVCVARSSNSNDPGGLYAKIAHFLGRLLYSRYLDVKIAPSDLAAMYTFGKYEYYKGNVKILHNAVDLSVYDYDEVARYEIRNQFNIPKNSIVIGHVGRFVTQKNHSFLVDIFQKYHSIHNNSVLMLVGNGTLENDVTDKVHKLGLQDNVIFTGIRNDIPQLLSAMDVFVFPSLYEGMPNTVIEAQATGLPCVISDTITKEANITGVVNYVSLTESPKQWAQKLLDCVSSQRLDTRNTFLAKKYDIESVAEEFEKIVFCSGDEV